MRVDGQRNRAFKLRQRVLEQVVLVRRPVVEILVRLLLVLQGREAVEVVERR